MKQVKIGTHELFADCYTQQEVIEKTGTPHVLFDPYSDGRTYGISISEKKKLTQPLQDLRIADATIVFIDSKINTDLDADIEQAVLSIVTSGEFNFINVHDGIDVQDPIGLKAQILNSKEMGANPAGYNIPYIIKVENKNDCPVENFEVLRADKFKGKDRRSLFNEGSLTENGVEVSGPIKDITYEAILAKTNKEGGMKVSGIMVQFEPMPKIAEFYFSSMDKSENEARRIANSSTQPHRNKYYVTMEGPLIIDSMFAIGIRELPANSYCYIYITPIMVI